MYTHIPPLQAVESDFSKIFYQQNTNRCFSGHCEPKKVEKERIK